MDITCGDDQGSSGIASRIEKGAKQQLPRLLIECVCVDVTCGDDQGSSGIASRIEEGAKQQLPRLLIGCVCGCHLW